MARFASMPGAIPMHGGLPPADAFPFSALSFALAPPAAGGGGGDAAAAPPPAVAAAGATPPASSEELEPVVEATIITTAAASNGKVADTTPSPPDQRLTKDHRHGGGPAVEVAASATAAAAAATAPGQRRLCRCNAAAHVSSGSSAAALPPTLVIDNPLVVASAQQYNIGNYGQAGLRAWAARATAELQRPAPIVGSAAWLKKRERQQEDNSTTPAPPPGPPRAAVSATLHRGGRDLAMTAGSTAALDAALRALLSRGDALLAEQFTYSHALEALMAPHGYRLIAVNMDRDQGLCPRALDEAARREAELRGRPPKVLYTIPVGQNPTGCVASAQRLKEVYEVARKWGMVIIEDDAYCWLRLHNDGGGEGGGGGGAASHGNGHAATSGPLSRPLLPRPGLLSLDEDGRVLRLDTFAKLLAPGLRLGWATGPARLVRVVAEATMAATVGPPALSQAVASGLLQRWGCCCCVFEDEEEEEVEGGGGSCSAVSAIGPGFRHYLSALQRRYAVQADLAARCAARHLEGVADFVQPRAGMFLWVRLLPTTAAEEQLVVDGDSVVRRAGDLGVAVVPGRIFAVESYVRAAEDEEEGGRQAASAAASAPAPRPLPPCPYLRVSFVNTPPHLVDEGLRRLRQAVDEELAEMALNRQRGG
jgi:DNA-binding transcriptional MocR family regulator